MHEVHGRPLRHTGQRRLRPIRTSRRPIQLAPPDVGNAVCNTSRRHLRYRLYTARDQTQTRVFTKLFTSLKQHLCANAYAQERPTSIGKTLDQVIKTAMAHLLHSTNEGAYSRQHKAIRQISDLRGPVYDSHRRPATLQCTHNIEQVTYTVVDDSYFRGNHSRTSSPAARASVFSARTEVRFQCNASATANPEAPPFAARARSTGCP